MAGPRRRKGAVAPSPLPRLAKGRVGHRWIRKPSILGQREAALFRHARLGDIGRGPRRRHDKSKGTLRLAWERSEGRADRRIQGLSAGPATPLFYRRRLLRLVLAFSHRWQGSRARWRRHSDFRGYL